MAKSAEAFRTISEVAEWLDLPTHVLRFWESKFTQVKPVKRAGGRRYYRPNDMLLLGGIKKLLHDDGMTIKGAQKVLREQGVKHVSSLSQSLDGTDTAAPESIIDQTPDTPPAQQPAVVAPVVEQNEPEPASEDITPEPEVAASEPDAEPESAPISFPSRADEAEPVVQAAADSTPDPMAAEPDAPAEPAAEVEEAEVVADLDGDIQPAAPKPPATGLPSFLTGNDTTEAAPEPEVQALDLTVDTPDDPSDETLDTAAGILSRLAATKAHYNSDTRAQLAEAKTALSELLAEH